MKLLFAFWFLMEAVFSGIVRAQSPGGDAALTDVGAGTSDASGVTVDDVGEDPSNMTS
jgi:hypothetical protein